MPMETKDSMYTILLTLTIRDMRPSDFANYTCIARNSMGAVRGTISVKGKLSGQKCMKQNKFDS